MQQVIESDDGVQRRTDFVAHVRQEAALGPIGHFGLVAGAGQFAGPIGHFVFEVGLVFGERSSRLPVFLNLGTQRVVGLLQALSHGSEIAYEVTDRIAARCGQGSGEIAFGQFSAGRRESAQGANDGEFDDQGDTDGQHGEDDDQGCQQGAMVRQVVGDEVIQVDRHGQCAEFDVVVADGQRHAMDAGGGGAFSRWQERVETLAFRVGDQYLAPIRVLCLQRLKGFMGPRQLTGQERRDQAFGNAFEVAPDDCQVILFGVLDRVWNPDKLQYRANQAGDQDQWQDEF